MYTYGMILGMYDLVVFSFAFPPKSCFDNTVISRLWRGLRGARVSVRRSGPRSALGRVFRTAYFRWAWCWVWASPSVPEKSFISSRGRSHTTLAISRVGASHTMAAASHSTPLNIPVHHTDTPHGVTHDVYNTYTLLLYQVNRGSSLRRA
jgi:hypothetical protein